MNSYQKLKEENKMLKEDIRKILSNDIEVILRYSFKNNLEDLSMLGDIKIHDATNGRKWITGLLPAIKYGN